jgi:virginiamycin B lyase
MRIPLLTALLALSTACVHRPPAADGWPADAGWPTEIREYVISDTSAFPNDLAIAADGSVWYTDRMTSRIGHLDPETGEIRQHRTPTPASAPYGITIAEDGSVWYAGSRAGVLGRLDPSTGTIAEYRVGEGGPHGVVALGDRIWFTMRRSGSYGWLHRETLEIRRFDFPGPAGHAAQDRGPYALVAGARGSLWFTAMRTGALFRVDTRDGSLRRFDLGTRGWARRLAVDRNGDVWYGNFPASRLGRLVPSTGEVEEIQLVKRPAEPYGIAVASDGRVWFNEARNERLIGYDPATDEIRVLVIPTAGAIIRGMAVDMERSRIWLPLSGTHRIGRIDLPKRDEQD